MKNLSTPVADKKCPILEANETIYNRNEGITFKNNPAGSDSPFFVNISPINMSCNMNKTREVMSNHENNGSGAILHNDPLEDDLSSLECKTSTNPEVIDYNINESREGMSDHGSNGPDDIDSNNALQYDRISFECNNSTNSKNIDYDINKSRERMTDHESNERDDIDSNNTLQYDRTSFECNNSTNSEDSDVDSESNCSLEDDSQEMDMKDLKAAVTEMTQALQIYIDKIKHLDISIEWELPETLKPTKGLRKSKGLKGPLGPEEISYIKKRFRLFCEKYNVNYGAMRTCLADRVSKFRFPNELRLKFIQYLCKDYINDRNPSSILRAISKLGIRKGKFSEDEENFLIEMYHNYRGSYLHSVCGLLLNRHRKKVFKKFELLKKKGFLGSRPSSNVKIKPLKLQNLILKEMLIRRNYDVKLLKTRLNTRSWLAMGKEHNVSPALAKAIYICKIYPQIFAVHPVKFNRFFTKMLYSIIYSDWKTWKEVQWIKLSSLLYDVGPVFVYVMLRKIITNCVPKEKWTRFKECTDYLNEHVLPYFENGTTNLTLNKINICN